MRHSVAVIRKCTSKGEMHLFKFNVFFYRKFVVDVVVVDVQYVRDGEMLYLAKYGL